MSRWIRFLIAIAFGAVLGLAYGWLVSPVRYVDTTPATLRIDFKTDFVLMTAEAFQSENDLGLAVRRLALLGDASPLVITSQAIQFAQKAGYNEADIARMQALMSAIQTLVPIAETPEP